MVVVGPLQVERPINDRTEPEGEVVVVRSQAQKMNELTSLRAREQQVVRRLRKVRRVGVVPRGTALQPYSPAMNWRILTVFGGAVWDW